MKALITGHRGFIGRHLNERLEALGWEVYGIDLKDGWDVANPMYLKQFPIPDVVFHLAAHPVTPSPNTIDAMYTIIDYVNAVNAQLIFASSAAVYAPHMSVYGAQKTLCEQLMRKYMDKEDRTILRFFNVFGPGGSGVIDRFCAAALNNKPLVIHGAGTQRRDYIHVDDVVSALVLVAEQDLGGIFDIGTSISHSVNELLNFFPGAKVKRVVGETGVSNSEAVLDTILPWLPVETDIENYVKKTLNELK